MIARIRLLSSLLLALTFLFFAGSGAAQDVSPRCEAAIDRAAGTYSRCLLGAQTRNALSSNASRLESAEQRCADRFDAATARALARAEQREETCTPLLVEIADRSVSYAEGVAKQARGERVATYLFVQDATGATLSGTTLTLTQVRRETDWFTNRPNRLAGKVPNLEFIKQWDEGENSFADDPPNADLTCEVDGEVVNYFVELTSPRIAGYDLSYTVSALRNTELPQTPITCDGEAELFIDLAWLCTCGDGTLPFWCDGCGCGDDEELYVCAKKPICKSNDSPGVGTTVGCFTCGESAICYCPYSPEVCERDGYGVY